MKKNKIKFVFVILVLLSLFSSIYLNRMDKLQSAELVEIQEMRETNDQLITNIKFVTVVIDKVLDIVTTRRS